MRRWTVLVALALAAAGAGAFARGQAEQQADPGVLLGILRRDGILIPFAQHDGRRWSNPWPAPDPHNRREIPLTIDDVPRDWWGRAGAPVLEWTIWKTGGERSRVHVTQPTRVMAHCQSSVGLRTDHVSPQPAPPPGFNPYPKDGLGVSTALDLLPIETLARTAPEWAAVDRVLAAPFNRVEELAIRRFSGWKHPMPKGIREATPPELERLYRARLPDGRSMCYVEAVKRYPPVTERDTCDLVMFVSGWITLDASGKPVDPSPDRRRDERDPGDPELDGLVTYCDRLRALFQLPLGIVPAGGELFWVGQWSGWTEEHYVIRRIGARDGKVELSVPGGWCAR